MEKEDNLIKNKITNEALNDLPLNAYQGEIVVVENTEDISQVIKEMDGEKVLGFDTETRPSFKKGKTNLISLIQLSTEKSTYLIRTHKTGVTDELLHLLSNEDVKKVGVGIRDDIRGLQKLKAFTPGGFVELQTMAVDKGLKDFSLKKLAGILLEFRVSKRQRLSNWEADQLTQGQMVYAATDSWVALEIFKKLSQLDSSNIVDADTTSVNN
ncbi:3'-5' exonuclease [Saccharicrinis fermentans]|uniref:3'-5' exonuclease n=1 Tax=Saccharicrinis fermentans DSM 9555 = JCM 21142 TaxID=869213 RepID=W7YAV1_9BACT|nr:3'-5' exonuclease [Saccharicrinis fermentans]GAF04728.1 ribonuclease D [Saccharicrinis fermentans DSM 9555 = JCM 21142]